MLPLSHDEVVHEKRSLLGKMPGGTFEQFANLRALYGYQWLFTGKPLMFMGGELGQRSEWDVNGGIDWDSLGSESFPLGLQNWVKDLNRLYRDEPALWVQESSYHGFYWIDCSDDSNSIFSFVRQKTDGSRCILTILNLTPKVHKRYRVGLPQPGFWGEVLNSDSEYYQGDNLGNSGGLMSQEIPWHNQPWSAEFILPGLSCSVFLHG